MHILKYNMIFKLLRDNVTGPRRQLGQISVQSSRFPKTENYMASRRWQRNYRPKWSTWKVKGFVSRILNQ